MMKIKEITLLLLIILFAGQVVSQNPGYQGKKFKISFGVSGMPMFGSFIANEEFWDFNMRKSIGLEYVLSKKISIGLNIDIVDDMVMVDYSSLGTFSGNNVGVFTRFYSHESYGSIAPLGKYASFEIMYNDIYVSNYGNMEYGIHSITTCTFLLGVGFQYIYFDSLTLDFSFNCGINPVGYNSVGSKTLYYGDRSYFFRSHEKMFSDYLVFVKVSLGYLVF